MRSYFALRSVLESRWMLGVLVRGFPNANNRLVQLFNAVPKKFASV